ncbi:MAG: bifunctional methylenetetrahydrofolate dehydrogenase/methenyltetrahydrofolate cyclohydrolase FolD [Sedimentisphaerales bacterium]|nr:bifunctional methylenetetrahydrofolate dehydrogenase/methenyltetrahydrofolate cyclohydrolase FolD [Sedimentisphaerales bacterium]
MAPTRCPTERSAARIGRFHSPAQPFPRQRRALVSATILDGKALAQQIRDELAEEVAEFIQDSSVVPGLATVLVGDDPASQIYVRNKKRACDKAGIENQQLFLPEDSSMEELLTVVSRLNKDPAIHGILVQTPLPDGLDQTRVLDAISPMKDVDAFHSENVGRIVQGRPRFLPCTPAGIQELLLRSQIEIAGANVVVVGRSDIVGKPIALMLMQRDARANATVTVCHSRTRDLPAVCRGADILIVAIGRAKYVTGEMVKPGATVIDVGINRTDDGLVGDVDFDSVKEVAGRLTPVPGGVGPLTIAMLLHNTLRAARLQIGS